MSGMARFLGKAGASLSRARDELRRVDEHIREGGERWVGQAGEHGGQRSVASPRSFADRPDSTDRDTEPFSVEDDD
jgi:hypothetical protein